jgi:tRNA(Ile)-lysidine synthase
VPFYLQIAPEVTETEAAARQWRYQALIEVARAQGYPVITTGHTQSDRAETLLYNLMRGAGADGLGALRWKRPLAENIRLVRPLLAVSRAETGEFCQQQHLPVWHDPYNRELKYARNRIRQELLPYLQTHFNPRVERTLAQTAELLRADVDYLETAAKQLREQATSFGNMESGNDEPIPVGQTSRRLHRSVLRQASLALQRRALRQFLQESQATAPSFEQIEEVAALISAPNRSRTSTFPGGMTAVVWGDWIVLQE